MAMVPDGARTPDWARIGAITAIVGVFAITVGLTSPLLSLVLQAQGVSATMIGANAAMTPLGVMVSAAFAPAWAERFGATRFAVLSLLAGASLLAFMGIWQNLWPWFPARFLLGFTIGAFHIVNKAWMNRLARPSFRGRIMGLYTSVLAFGFALGPFVIAFTGSAGQAAFLVGICALLASAGSLLIVARHLPNFGASGRGGSVRTFLPFAPVLLVAVAAFGFFDHATLALLPAYGLRHGWGEAAMASALGILNIGNVLLQFPIGWLADRLPRRHVLVACALATIAGSFALPLLIGNTTLLLPLLFVWGACAYGVTTVSLAELGDRFQGSLLLAGSAAFTMMGGIGGIVGAPVTGGAMDVLGPAGLPLSLGAAFTILAALAAFLPLVRRVPGGMLASCGSSGLDPGAIDQSEPT